MAASLSHDPNDYVPPQVTETWGEQQFNDCTWASGYALVDIWTTGAVTRDRNWRPFGQARLKGEREALREASGDLLGGSTLDDLARGIAAYWPDLPRLRRSTNGGGVGDFAAMWEALMGDESVLLQGNPSRIPNQQSFLRTAQGNDDYDHSILVVRSREDAGLVMDPLRPWTAKPRWVPKAELRQFASRFRTAQGEPYYAIVKRGAQGPLGRALQEVKRLRDQLAGRPVSCDDAVTQARRQGIADAAAAAAAVK
jgi:hypothetical protein